MRLSLVTAAVFFAAVQLAAAGGAQATIRKPTHIPAEPLGIALQTLAKERGFQVAYVSSEVDAQRTRGASGDLTVDEALAQVLRGTGLTFRHVADNGVSILPAGAPAARTRSVGDSSATPPQQSADRTEKKEGKTSSSDEFRLAQVDQGPTASARPLESGSSTQLQAVIVTAQKRAETVDTTPVAVTALSMDQLAASGVGAIKDLTSTVPNLQIHTIGLDSFVGVTIRGVSNGEYGPSGNPAVSTYVDGVYVDQPVGFSDELYDLERLEVLRGPQGTLYGRNSTGGNLNIVTADPRQTLGASADLSYGNYGDVMAHAMVNVPLSDTLAIRAAAMSHRSDGYFNTENTTLRNYGAADDFALRLTALWMPTDRFKWRLSFDGVQGNGTPGASIETGDDQRPLNGLSPYHQPTSPDPEPVNYLRSAAVRSRMDWRMTDALTLSYIAGYQHLRWYYAWSTTGQVGAPNNPAYQSFIDNWSTAWSHEVDVSLDTKRVKNVFGATYFNDWVEQNSWGLFPILGNLAYNSFGDGIPIVKKASWGVFDQATLSILPTLRLTAGVRYSHDKQEAPVTSTIYCVAPPGTVLSEVPGMTATSPGCGPPVVVPGDSGTWSNTSWKAGLEYDLNDRSLAYASVTTGYKMGGVQPGLPAVFPATFDPEHVTSYELGLKMRLLARSLSVRLAGFDEEYKNQQVFQYFSQGETTVLATTNAGTSRIYGAELEGQWQATRRDYLSTFLTYLHARYTKFDNAVDSRFDTVIPSLAGSELPNAPAESARLTYRHDFLLPNGGELSPLASIYWQATSYTEDINVDVYKIPAYTKSDFRLAYSDPTDHWRLAAYVDNIENHAVRNSDFSSSGLVFSDFNAPRTFGVRLDVRF